jgi:hypothetical protein
MGRTIKGLKSTTDGLSPKQEMAAVSLAGGATLEEAAIACSGVARTIKTWSTLPAFRQKVSEVRSELTSRALGKLVENMTSAADTLGYLSRKSKSENIRLSASRAIIELGTRLRDMVELEARIAALETNEDNRRVVA